MSSRQEIKVEHKVSVAAFTSRDVKWVGEGREEDTTAERREGERERRSLPCMCVLSQNAAKSYTTVIV